MKFLVFFLISSNICSGKGLYNLSFIDFGNTLPRLIPLLKSNLGGKSLALSDSEIKKLDLPIFDSQKLDPPKKFALSERDSTESEIEYIDYDQLKNRFNSLATGKNKFEEETQGVFRETRYGYSTVYRLMIETPDSFEVLRILNGLRDKYKLEKAGDVEPGTFIPGGNYYNLLIENHKVEKFLEDASTLKPMIYASRSKGRSVPGKTKLFIFVNKL